MKKVLSYVFSVLAIVPIVIFSIGFLFNDNFNRYGELLDVVDSTEKTGVEIDLNEEIGNANAPTLEYMQGPQEVGNCFVFKSVLQVTTETGIKNGTVEDDFAIYLSDIKSGAGTSVVEFLSKEQIESLEEIPAAFLYDQENDMLYCYKSGAYKVIIKVYGSNGTQVEYEFILPVEAEG